MLLEKISSPADLRKLNRSELPALAKEIREELIHTVSVNGGHLASNLGIVELTIALHRNFDTPADKLIFDVGHQSYVHKMLTGRFSRFSTLREYGGIAGFPKRNESEYDCFETGHASTAISAALGIARARDLQQQNHHVVAVVGDGALTGGMCYEALNDAGNSRTRMIIVINDNEMSIAPNVGALSAYLTNLRISAGWQSAKSKVRRLAKVPVVGKPAYRMIHGTKKLIKNVVLRDNEIGFFEALGFQYFGPVDGHDIQSLEKTFQKAKAYNGPCVIHILTKKGYGYEEAEKRPEAFHGTPPFYIETGDRIKTPSKPSAGHVMADTLAELCASDNRIIAITAAMKLGTGLDHFEEKMPGKLIDVGIAEEHAATMAAGLAAGGMRPYFAVYASFFQRCFDQMIHDVCMQDLPVVFLLDRSGIGGEDGQTHHGVFDFASLLPVPGMTVLAPADTEELKQMIQWTICQDHPVAIRYGKNGLQISECHEAGRSFRKGRWEQIRKGEAATLLAAGSMVKTALEAAKILEKERLSVSVYNCSTIKPLDEECLRSIPEGTPVLTIEEHMVTGGFGMYVSEICRSKGYTPPCECIGIPDLFIQHGSHDLLLQDAGLGIEQVTERIRLQIGGKRP